MAERSDRSFGFWRAWMLSALAMQGLGGYAIAFAYARVPGLGWHRDGTGEALWGSAEYPQAAAAYRDFSMAIIGATTASWAVALLFVVALPFARRERWSWWCVTLSLLAWAPVDTGLSLAHGVEVNALFNVCGTAMIAIPLAATWRVGTPR